MQGSCLIASLERHRVVKIIIATLASKCFPLTIAREAIFIGLLMPLYLMF